MIDILDESIDKIHEKIHRAKSVDTLCEIYLYACSCIKQLDYFKKYIMNRIEKVLVENESEWGECETATYGITNPKPRAGVNEDAWREAVSSSAVLASLQDEYESARMPFVVDKTSAKRTFIKRKSAK